MKPLVDLARSRGLDPALLENETFLEAAPVDASMTPPMTKPIEVLDGLRRRGLDPALLPIVRELLRDRPLELALVAWDYLAGCIFEPGTRLVDELRSQARTIAEVLPGPGERFVAGDRTKEVVQQLALPPYLDLTVSSYAAQLEGFAIANIEVGQRLHEHDGRPINEASLKATHQFARYLAYAHLNTAASFYLQYLVRRCGYAPAIYDYVDAMLDGGAGTSILLREERKRDPVLASYVDGRFYIERDLPELFSEKAAEVNSDQSPRVAIVAAHAVLAADERLLFSAHALAEIFKTLSDWRYGARVSLAVVAHLAPSSSDLPLRALDQFLMSFGNDTATWRELDNFSPPGSSWLDGMWARSVREVTALPHDRAAWEALGVNLGYEEQKQWEEVVKSRIREQCKLD